jgi:hypothetical protein
MLAIADVGPNTLPWASYAIQLLDTCSNRLPFSQGQTHWLEQYGQ